MREHLVSPGVLVGVVLATLVVAVIDAEQWFILDVGEFVWFVYGTVVATGAALGHRYLNRRAPP